jgi:hypothetical protein
MLVVASVFVRRHGAGTEQRKQLAWLGYVGVMTVVWLAFLLTDVIVTDGGDNWAASLGWVLMFLCTTSTESSPGRWPTRS